MTNRELEGVLAVLSLPSILNCVATSSVLPENVTETTCCLLEQIFDWNHSSLHVTGFGGAVAVFSGSNSYIHLLRRCISEWGSPVAENAVPCRAHLATGLDYVYRFVRLTLYLTSSLQLRHSKVLLNTGIECSMRVFKNNEATSLEFCVWVYRS